MSERTYTESEHQQAIQLERAAIVREAAIAIHCEWCRDKIGTVRDMDWHNCPRRPILAIPTDQPALDRHELVRDEIEECAKIIDECNRQGPYLAIGAASMIRSRKSLYAKVVQSEKT